MLPNLSLSEKIQKAIQDMGFTEPTPIQEQAIPLVLEGKDLIGQAQTGTGKTAAFAIPILECIDTEDRRTQALIMSPTRELAMQITEEFKKLAKYMPEIEPLAVYGGQPIDIQLRALRRCPQIVIGTPGRIMDHIRRKTLDLSNIKIVTLDEADEMLDMGFRDDIKGILDLMPEERQTLLFSATMPRPIMELSKQYLKNPEHVKTIQKTLTASAIEQTYFEVKERNKLEVMTRLIDQASIHLALVFCNTKKRVDEVVENLAQLGYKAEGLHGDLRQSQRDAIMNKFRSGNLELLVATDVAARGLDVDDIEVVFNYDIPQDAEYYTHRIGRTGRAGKSGKAYTFVTGREVFKLKDIMRITKSEIKLGAIPSKKEVESQKAKQYIDQVLEELQKAEDLSIYRNYIDTLENDEIDLKDFLAAILKMNLSSQKKDDLFTEIADKSKTVSASSYQFHSQEEHRSDFKRERRFSPSGPRTERPSYGPRTERPSYGPRTERPSYGPKNNSSSSKPTEYRDHGDRPSFPPSRPKAKSPYSESTGKTVAKESPAAPSKPRAKKKTIYKGPDQPRVTFIEK